MITQRFENFKFGSYDTVQTFYTCDWCKEETNAVEWYVSIAPEVGSVYTCPVCQVKHSWFRGWDRAEVRGNRYGRWHVEQTW